MNSLFIRVFLALAGVLACVGAVDYWLFSTLNHVRLEHHRTELAMPLTSWMMHLSQDELSSTVQSHIPHGGQLSIVPMKALSVDQVLKERISWGQTVVRVKRRAGHVFHRYGDHHVLVLYLPVFDQQVTQTYAAMIQASVDQTQPGQQVEFVQQLAAITGTPIEILGGDEPLEQVVMDELADAGRSWQLNEQGVGTLYLKLKQGEIASIPVAKTFYPFAWPVVLTLLLFSVLILGGAVYLALSTLNERLKKLEMVAGRIARGELDARVKVQSGGVLARLGESFNSMADHIQRLVLVQKEMIHAVSHELRTPVARIRFGVQMIEDCTDPEARSRQLKGIDNDIQELDELIDEILTYARLEQGGPILDFQESDIVKIVSQVVSEQSLTRPDLKISAEFLGNSRQWRLTEIEPRYLHRAIQNLVGNATRYCKSQVLVRCHFDEENCRVDVEDDGPGIPESDWEKVFTPFARLDDSRTRSSGGYGLGLSIVRRILYWHGGQAMLGRSELGGAKFSLIWPRRQPR